MDLPSILASFQQRQAQPAPLDLLRLAALRAGTQPPAIPAMPIGGLRPGPGPAPPLNLASAENPLPGPQAAPEAAIRVPNIGTSLGGGLASLLSSLAGAAGPLPPGPAPVGPSPIAAWAGAQPAIGPSPGDSFGGAGAPAGSNFFPNLVRALGGQLPSSLPPVTGLGGFPALADPSAPLGGTLSLSSPEPAEAAPAEPAKKGAGTDPFLAALAGLVTPQRGAGGATTISIPGSGGTPAAPSGDDLTRSLIKSREGFRETPYFDVNALRAGYGSDTYTAADGSVHPVTPGTRVTRDMAEQDLTRRIGEFQAKARDQVGDAWDKLSPGAVAGLTSVAYNYGRLPSGVAEAAKTGDPEQIAKAIEARSGDNDGVNAGRRVAEAGVVRGQGLGGGQAPSGGASASGLPSPPVYGAPQIGTPPAIQALKAADPSSYDAFNALSVVRPPPLSQGDRLTNILAAMAQGGQGAKSIGDFLLGAGGGALSGAAGLVKQQRGEDLAAAREQQQLNILKAGKGVEKAGAVAAAQNTSIQAANENARRAYDAAVEQSRLDTEAKNKTMEAKSRMDLVGWDHGQPQVLMGKDGESLEVIRKKADGGVDLTTVPLGAQNGFLKGINKLDKTLDGLGIPQDSALREPLKNQMVAVMGYQMGGAQGIHHALMDTLMDQVSQNGQWKDVLPKSLFSELDKKVQASTTAQELAAGAKAPEIYARKFKALLNGMRAKDPSLDKNIAEATRRVFGNTGPGSTAGTLLGQ